MPDMQMVDSSTMEAVGYDAAARELLVQFTGGKLYAYLDVDEYILQELLMADSKGSYFNREIKPRYQFDVR
jgi:hypothetical protein